MLQEAEYPNRSCIVVRVHSRCEVFGYDFMLDDEYNLWLIEINSSPTMERCTKVTSYSMQCSRCLSYSPPGLRRNPLQSADVAALSTVRNSASRY